MNERLIFKAFRAINDLDACLNYKEGHNAVLKDYGITNVTTNNDIWMQNPNMYCIVALSADRQETLGGIRIQISDEETLLPVEKAIGKMDGRIYQLVEKFRNNGGVGELCALWNAKKVAGVGISILLTRAGISVTNQLNITTLVGICGEYTLKMFQKVGFVVDHSLGFNGLFPYPKEEFTARVLGILNSATLDTADPYDKERIKAVREKPVQIAIEQGTREQIEIEYNLLMHK
ncbi:MAG TPA: hypothetical protein PL029_00635 [Bacteroidia bacterium]|nr:hypothetical protein [Bacteroidia bacterium]